MKNTDEMAAGIRGRMSGLYQEGNRLYRMAKEELDDDARSKILGAMRDADAEFAQLAVMLKRMPRR